uniref:Uncharacterized protein n=1 Tax=Lepeophtheirus salmonis TaxID=72036 RepID=A0A0K2UII7_LEPSM
MSFTSLSATSLLTS